MRKSRAETAETRTRIVEVAAREFRKNGIQATSISEIMAAAGMTNGGFYRHFESKEQLVAAASAQALAELVEAASEAAGAGKNDFHKYIQSLLSEKYRDDRLGGCPLVAMGSEIARADADIRRSASQGFQDLIDVFAQQEVAETPAQGRAEAMFKLSAMIGAVTMARIVDDEKVSRSILLEAKRRLT